MPNIFQQAHARMVSKRIKKPNTRCDEETMTSTPCGTL